MSIEHVLKIETEYYQAVERGDKPFEIRKNDRDFNTCDVVTLVEVVGGVKTGRQFSIEINYILHGGKYGLAEGYCIFSWK